MEGHRKNTKIIGVNHSPCSDWETDVIEKIKDEYPDGLESMALEIPKNYEETSLSDTGFNRIADEFESDGTKVIYADLPYNLPDFYKKAISEYQENPTFINTARAFGLSMGLSFVDQLRWGVVDGFVTHERDRNFLEVVETEQPDVLVVGKIHARYLKKRL